MTLVKMKPVKKVGNPIFNPFFDEIFNQKLSAPRNYSKQPAVNIIETADNFQIQLAVPGLNKSDISINVEKDTLKIAASKEHKTVEGEVVKRREFNFNTFEKSFQLPETIDTGKINAAYNNGILNVSLPKKEEAKELPPRNIEIA